MPLVTVIALPVDNKYSISFIGSFYVMDNSVALGYYS